MKHDKRGHLILEAKDCRSESEHSHVVDGGLAYCVSCYGGEVELEETCASRRRRLMRDQYMLTALESLDALVILGPESSTGIRPAMMNLDPDPHTLTLAREIVAASNSRRLRWNK